MSRRLWIAVEAHLVSRDIVGHGAEVLGVSRVTCVGHMVTMWGQVAEDAKAGDISGVRDSTLEHWAEWGGEAGRFAGFIREHCVTAGVLNGWDEMQGPLDARREADRTRKQAQRDRAKASARPSRDGHVTSARTEHNRTEPITTTAAVPVDRKAIIGHIERPVDPRVEQILAHYRAVHPKRRPGPKVKLVVIRALRSYSVEELTAAIDGNAADAWHRERGKHELDYVLRDNEKIDSFRLKPAVRDWSKEPMTDGEGKFTPAYHEWTAAGCP